MTADLQEAVMMVKNAFAEEPPEGALKLGVDVRAGDVSFVEDDILQYRFDVTEGPATQAEDLVDSLVSLWRETELISLEDPVALNDAGALLQLKEKVATARSEFKEGELAYNIAGVGGEVGCALQIVADRGIAKPEQIASLAQEMVFNAVKIRLRKVGSISAAMAIGRACQQSQISVIFGCDEGAPESPDNFLGDLAVAMGAGQIAAGGLGACEYSCKYQRILEIARGDDSIPYAGRKFRK
jgi:enolase